MQTKIHQLLTERTALLKRIDAIRADSAKVDAQITQLTQDGIPDGDQLAELSDLRTKASLYRPALADAEQKLESLTGALRKLIDEASAELDRWARQEASAGQAALQEALRGILENEEDVRAASAEYADWTRQGRAARRLRVQVANLRTLLPSQFEAAATQLADYWAQYQAAKQPAA